MSYIESIRKLALAREAQNAAREPKASFKREPSKTESEAEYRPQGFGLLHCPHARTYISTCSRCKRDAKEANFNLTKLLARV